MSEHNIHIDDEVREANSRVDAKAAVALVFLIVLTVSFWLAGQ